MAGEIDYGTIANATGGVATAILWILIGVTILAVIGFIIWWYSHKVIFIVRKITGDRPLTRVDRARIITQKGKPIKWKLRGLKANVPVPPKEAIDITTKGKLFVEAYLTEDGEFHYITDKMTGDIGSLYPVKNVDKEFYAQQVEEAEKYKNKGLKEILLTVAPYLTVVLILVLFMIFFNETVAPSIELGNSLVSASENLGTALKTFKGCSQTISANIPIPN